MLPGGRRKSVEALQLADTSTTPHTRASGDAATTPSKEPAVSSPPRKETAITPATESPQPPKSFRTLETRESTAAPEALQGEVKPMYQWVFGAMAKPLKRWTAGTARVDLRRPCLPLDHGDDDTLWRISGNEKTGDGPPTTAARLLNGVCEFTLCILPPRFLRFAICPGARMKLMRDVQLWKRTSSPPWLSIGVGCQFEMDDNAMTVQARLKVSDYVTFKVLPKPMIRVHRSIPLLDTGLVATIQYTCPFVDGLYSPFYPPARLLVRLDNRAGSGIHFSPYGIEVDKKVVTLGSSTRIRVAAGVNMPRQIPVTDGDSISFKIHRLGLKAAW